MIIPKSLYSIKHKVVSKMQQLGQGPNQVDQVAYKDVIYQLEDGGVVPSSPLNSMAPKLMDIPLQQVGVDA